jgi:putative hemolysin
VDSLPADQLLLEADDLAVYHARARQIPDTMRELGRLREITFRATGEGTGKSFDIDRFDEDYVQVFVWSRARREIVGAYRLGPTDEILPAKGKQGLYTSTLFNCHIRLLEQISPALELGRSFVRSEHQKSYQPLLLLWKGIGQYCRRNLRYRHLFGPVSISNTYQSMSKQLMVHFLRVHHLAGELVRLVRPRNPFRTPRVNPSERSAYDVLLRDSEDVSDLVADLEPDQKGIPVLLRQYLKMGAKLLAFNVDPAFADCVDGLLVADMAQTDVRLLDRYMGRAGRMEFLEFHRRLAEGGER